jgi:hypothetical protein
MAETVESLQEQIDAHAKGVQEWIDSTVKPVMQEWLEQLQKRCHRHHVSYKDGMGTRFVAIYDHKYRTSTDDRHFHDVEGLWEKRFPEIKWLLQIGDDVEDTFNMIVGDLKPKQGK